MALRKFRLKRKGSTTALDASPVVVRISGGLPENDPGYALAQAQLHRLHWGERRVCVRGGLPSYFDLPPLTPQRLADQQRMWLAASGGQVAYDPQQSAAADAATAVAPAQIPAINCGKPVDQSSNFSETNQQQEAQNTGL